MKFKLNYTIIAVCSAGLLATSGDLTMTWASPMHSKLYSNDTSINPLGKPITSSEDALIGSLINIGAIIGPFPFSFIADRFGRRIALLSAGVPHLVSYLLFAFATNVYMFYFGRLFGGLSVGAGYALLPMYIAEVSNDSTRGMLSAWLSLFWAVGNLIPYIVGPFVSVMVFNLVAACIPFAFLTMFLLFGVETPYYWLTKDQPKKAKESLIYLRSLNEKGVEPEMDHILKNFQREEGSHFVDIIRNPALRKALFISITLIALQQLGGINAIAFYLQPIFSASGGLSSSISSVIFGGAIFVTSFISPLLVDRFNRKTLINVSCAGTSIALILLGVFFYIHDSTKIDSTPISWIPLLSLILFLIFFASGDAVIPWIIAAELFPTSCKKISSSAVSSSCWLTSFIVTQFFTQMVSLITRAGVFWLFASWSAFTVGFCIFLIPETKDKSFREIQDILGS